MSLHFTPATERMANVFERLSMAWRRESRLYECEKDEGGGEG